jgi:hypothetical protein
MVDVGGGQRATLAAILRAPPLPRGLVFDLGEVVEHAAPLREPELVGRCEIIGHDMMQSVPFGVDQGSVTIVPPAVGCATSDLSPRGHRRPRVPDRAALRGIIFVVRTGIPWEYLPEQFG